MKLFNKLFIFLLIFNISSYSFTLKDGFTLALENDSDSNINKNNLQNIKYDQDIADSLLYPKVDFNATIETSKLTQDKLSPSSSASHERNDEYELSFTQPIFDGFEAKHEKQLQKERYKSAIYFLKESINKVAYDYTQSYINTLREKDLLNLNIENLAVNENIFNKVYKKVNSGYGTKLEFETAKGNLSESRVNLKIQKINFKEALENLKFYVQSDFDTSELIKPNIYIDLPKTLNEAIKISMSNNPSINVRKVNLEVSKLEKKKISKDFYPNVNLKGSYKINNALYAQDNEEYNEYTVGFELRYNLFNGGKDNATAKKAIQGIKEKQYLIKKSEYELKNKTRLAWNSYKLNKEKQDSLEQYLIVRKDILDATIKEFDLGLKDLNSMLDIHVDYIDVKKDLISNSYDLLLAKYKLLDVLGSLGNVLQDKLPVLKDIEPTLVESSTAVNNLFEDTKYSYNSDKDLNQKKLKYAVVKNTKFIESPKNYLRFKNQNYNTPSIIPANIVENIIIKNDKNKIIEFSSNNDNKTFKETFLSAPKNKYTINLALLTNEASARTFLNRHNIIKNAFSFSFGYEKSLEKVMYGIYDTKKDALTALNSLSNSLKNNHPRVENIFLKQKLYAKYHSKNKIPNDNTIVKKKYSSAKVYRTTFTKNTLTTQKNRNFLKPTKNSNFLNKFLLASKDKYTINLALVDNKLNAYSFLKRHHIMKKAFSFSFGYEKPLEKIMYGIYDTKKDAMLALNKLPRNLKKNRPRVENIYIKQKLFYKYNKFTFEKIGRI